jgi:hypothetical protein
LFAVGRPCFLKRRCASRHNYQGKLVLKWNPFEVRMAIASEIMVYTLVAVLVVGLYLLPSFVAANRKCKAGAGIAVINIFLGWTFIGWVVALAWASCGEVKAAI